MNCLSTLLPARRELLTVDLRGIKPALIERARMSGVSVGEWVRRAVDREMHGQEDLRRPSQERGRGRGDVRVSLRLSRLDAEELGSRARLAGLSLGRYVMASMRDRVEPSSAMSRRERFAALTRSNAELSTLSRNIAHLTSLLRQSSVRAAQEYRAMLDTLEREVRVHLALASAALAAERPVRASTLESTHE